MQDLIKQVAAIAELRKEATPGPWFTVGPPWGKGNWVSTQQDPHGGRCVCDCEPPSFDDEDEDARCIGSNTDFIAAAGSLDYAALLNALTATKSAPLVLQGDGPAADGWIDCAGRMPKAVEPVLALSVIPGDSRVYIARWMPHASPARWWLRDSPEQLAVVTHWMPLPAVSI